MAFFTIDINDNGVSESLRALAKRILNAGPVLKEIGEDIVDDAKRRFETSTGPDGNQWAPNAQATIESMVGRRGGIGKSGKINKKGAALAMAKKPLIGESGDLRRQISYLASNNALTITSNPIYAAIQQFGGKKSQFPNLWGDIPARPFLPIYQNGTLYPKDRDKILDTLNQYLAGS